MQHNAAFHQDLHCFLRLKLPSGTEMHHNLENYSCNTLKYTMPILILSICMGKSIRIQRDKYQTSGACGQHEHLMEAFFPYAIVPKSHVLAHLLIVHGF